MLELRKKGNKHWLLIDEEIGEFSPSKFTINRLNSKIEVVYFNNLKSKNYDVSDCYIFDIDETIGFNTSSGVEFMDKLEELNCPCFQKDVNNFYISGGTWGSITGDIEEQTDLTAKFNEKMSSDISTYTPATTPLSGTELALIDDGTGFKKVAVSEFGGGSKKYQTLLFQVPTNGTTLTADQKNYCQSRFNGQSVFGSLGLTLGSGVPEPSGILDLIYLSDVGVPNITPNYISKVANVNLSYSRNVAESGANTNIVIRLMGETKYHTDMQLIAEYNLVSSTFLGAQENKVEIPILTHLPLSAHSNLKWCIRTNNATAQVFNFIRLNIDIEEV